MKIFVTVFLKNVFVKNVAKCIMLMNGVNVPKRRKTMPRVYDQWQGRPQGIPEDPTRCVYAVPDETGWHFYQCSRKRGYGPNGEYCKQHAKIMERRLSNQKVSK
jgi:hypothetical protein